MPRWTRQARQRQSQLVKKWKPWKHSTGPRTEEGKIISSQNARKFPKELQDLLDYAKESQRNLKELEAELREVLSDDWLPYDLDD